jgi:rhodanese-related sulfurtransferase
MKFILSLFACCLLLLSCQTQENEVEVISAEEMRDLMILDSVQFIDVRSVEEFREGHLKGAQNLVYDEDFIEKIDALDKSKPVAVYCRTGRRSKECSEILIQAGFKKIYDLDGGLSQWKYKDDIIQETND